MPALPLLTLVPCAMVAMAFIGTSVHADRPAKLQHPEQMKAMLQAANGGSTESGGSQSRAATVVTFVVDARQTFRGAEVRLQGFKTCCGWGA